MKRSLPLTKSPPPRRHAMVLLSGGLDSVALLHYARAAYDEVAAVSIAYGQVNRDAELGAAGRIAERLGVPWSRFDVADAVRGFVALSAPTPGRDGTVSRANLPARNPILISIATAHACRAWPCCQVDVLVGATLDDAAGFPDCRTEFVEAMSRTMSYACAGVADVRIRAPWASKRKAEVIDAVSAMPGALDDLRASVSCYRGIRCGSCDACTLRASAFAAHGLADGSGLVAPMTGGDPAREARFR